MSKVKYQEFLIPCGDWNGHTGQLIEGFQGFHGGLAYGEKNKECKRLFAFGHSLDLVVSNSL